MSKHLKKSGKKAGLMVICLGIGLMLAVLVPFWGWILAAGAAMIIGGWLLIQNNGK